MNKKIKTFEDRLKFLENKMHMAHTGGEVNQVAIELELLGKTIARFQKNLTQKNELDKRGEDKSGFIKKTIR